MKNTLLRSVAAGALLVGSSLAMPAISFAQDTNAKPPAADTGTDATKPADTGTDATKPADTGTSTGTSTDTGTSSGMSTDTTKPADTSTDTTKPADTGTDTTTAPADSTAAGSSGGKEIMTEQEETQVLASTYIGQSVYNTEDKSIGDISDLLFNKDGGIQAAIIGVGGFLGIGQKDVAVKFDRIEIQREPDSADVKLVTDMTAEQLKQAPAFKNLQTKMNEENANNPPAATGTGGAMGTGGAAGTGTAPAQ